MKYIFAIVLAFSFSMTSCSNDETCAGGDCSCEEGGTCEFECSEGNCSQNCSKDSTCTFTCEGGGCSQQCIATAEKCDFSCAGGTCTQQCSGDQCTSSCSGGDCTTSGALNNDVLNNLGL